MRISILALALAVLVLGGCQSGPGNAAMGKACSPCDMMKAAGENGGANAFAEGGVRPTQAPDSRKLNLDPNANVSAGSGDSDNVQLKTSEDQTTTGTSAANSIFADSEAQANKRSGSTSPVVLTIRRTIEGLEKRAEQLDPSSNAWDKIQTRIAALTDKMMQADGQAAKTYIDFKDLTGATITQYVISATKSGRGSAIDPEAAAQFAQGIETIQGAMAAVQALKATGMSDERMKPLRDALIKKFGQALEDALADPSTDLDAETEPEPESTPAPAERDSRPSPEPEAPKIVIIGDTPKQQYDYARNMAIELANAGDMDGANRYKAIADDLASKHPEVLDGGE